MQQMTSLYCDSDVCVRNNGGRLSMATRILKKTVPEREFKPGMKCPDCSHVMFPRQIRTAAGVNRQKVFIEKSP